MQQSDKKANRNLYGPRTDIIGNKYGSYTVIAIAGRSEDQGYYYWCECECGAVRMVRYGSLTHKKYPNCGSCKIIKSFGPNQPSNALGENYDATLQLELDLSGKPFPIVRCTNLTRSLEAVEKS